MLSNAFLRLRQDPARARDAVHPPEMAPELLARVPERAEIARTLLPQFVDVAAPNPDPELERDLLERALGPDLAYERACDALRRAYTPALFATYYYGLDVLGHSFTRHAEPELYGDVAPEAARRYGRTIERYADYLGGKLAELERELGPDDVLIVASGYGMRPVAWWRRLLGGLLGGSTRSGHHDDAPDGVFLAVGGGIRPGAAIGPASVLDVAPTLLYLLGLPVARDMRGRVFTEMLEEEFARAHPVTYIPSYESLAVAPTAPSEGSDLPSLPEETP
jgi:hypothetical protein